MIAITTLSILAITGSVWIYNKVAFRFGLRKICPICAGVSGTWIAMLIARFAGFSIDINILFMLLGGSVVGIAYQANKGLLWKTLFIPTGFVAAYGLALSQWTIFLFSLAFLIILFLFFFSPPKPPAKKNDATIEKLEKKMEQCC